MVEYETLEANIEENTVILPETRINILTGINLNKLFFSDNLDFEKLQAYFDKDDDKRLRKNTLFKPTKKGLYVPCSLNQIYQALNYLINEDMIDLNKPFMDAGGGDGRVVALTSAIFNIESLMVEYDQRLCQRAERNIFNLIKKQILNENIPQIIRGDFSDICTYNNAGIDFRNIGTIYNYINNEEDIAQLISRNSPEGTMFLLLDLESNRRNFEKLEHKVTLEINDRVITPTDDEYIERRYMHVYNKV
jgi:hypothetical protein